MKVPTREIQKIEHYIRKARQRIVHSDTSSLEYELVDECLHICADFQQGIQLIKGVIDAIGDKGHRIEEVEHGIEHELIPKRWKRREN